MISEEFSKIVSRLRESVELPENAKKGTRFNSDDMFARRLRMETFQNLKLDRLPSFTQAERLIPRDQRNKFIEKILINLAKEDFHFQSHEQKGINSSR